MSLGCVLAWNYSAKGQSQTLCDDFKSVHKPLSILYASQRLQKASDKFWQSDYDCSKSHI